MGSDKFALFGQYQYLRCYLGTLSKLKSCYHKCIKMFFGCDRMYSVTNMFMDLGLPSFKTILVNSRAVFGRLKIDCKNVVIHHVRLIGH